MLCVASIVLGVRLLSSAMKREGDCEANAVVKSWARALEGQSAPAKPDRATPHNTS